MKIAFWVLGKTTPKYLEEGINEYSKRLHHYLPFEMEVIPDVRNAARLPAGKLAEAEGKMVLDKLSPTDWLVLLDEKGKQLSSVELAAWMEKTLNISYKRVVFLVGGAFGFSEAVYQRANANLSLSSMTFSHQMVRLFFLEQLYRAMTILRNEPYHNE